MEWTESKSYVRVKSTSVEEQGEEGAVELQSKIDSLTSILSPPCWQLANLRKKEKKEQGKEMQKGEQRKAKSTPTTPIKGKGPGTPTMDASKGNQKPIQCYNCRRRGHGWRECPSKGNFNCS